MSSLSRRSRAVLLLIALAGAAGAQTTAQKQAPDGPSTIPGSSPPARTLTLDQAVQIALQNSKPLRLAAEAVNRARGRVNEARAGFNPTLTGDFAFTRLDEGSEITFPGPTGQPQTIPIVRQNQRSVGVAASLPIDITGQIRAAVQQSQFQEIVARLDYNRTRNQTVLDVKNAYFDVLRSKAFVAVAEQALKNAQDRQATTEAYLRAGTGTRFDVLRAQTEVANAQQSLIAARNRVSLAIAALNNLLSLDQNTPIEAVEASEAAEPQREFNASVSEAYENRPEILQAEAQIRAAERGVFLALRSVLPSFGLGWNFQFTPDQGGFDPKEQSWQAVARVTIPLFDAGASRARTQQARADVASARVNKQAALDTVALEVRQAYLAVVEAQDRLNVTSAALEQAQEQYRLAQVRFRAGVTLTPGGSPLLEISDAQTALTQAQTNHVNARYDLQNARARLDRAVGRYAYDGTARPGLPQPRPIK